MQALILAAGMGNRLLEYTRDNTKCMVRVSGKRIIDRTMQALKAANINRIIVVLGYKKENLKDHIEQNHNDMEVVFLENDDYERTNNIHSLYLARHEFEKDDTILVESDLVFEEHLIKKIVNTEHKNLVAVAKYEHWMDGTVTKINSDKEIIEFVDKQDFSYELAEGYYKTVNVYKFSKEFIQSSYMPFLEAYIKVYGENQYYESVLKIIAYIEKIKLKAYVLETEKWYEIDTPQDLDIANIIFSSQENKFEAYDKHYGGFWRFPKLKDFCYLVNPYYPPKRLVDHINYFSSVLIREYPSGLDVQNANAAHMFNIDKKYMLVGNGAAELISSLGKTTKGKLGMFVPAFNEYVSRFQCTRVEYNTKTYNYRLDLSDVRKDLKNLDHVIIVNPDNPSGGFIEKQEMLEFIKSCHENKVNCIVDESFIDFSKKELRYTLIENDILSRYPNLTVIKSISKSYGIPGLRLGIMASSNISRLQAVREHLPIWNINSYAEYFLQIQSLYKSVYNEACDKIAKERAYLMEHLQKIEYINVYPSQANYIMCALNGKIGALDLANRLLVENDIFIKDLSQKYGFDKKEYIRIAVKNRSDNNELLAALKNMGAGA